MNNNPRITPAQSANLHGWWVVRIDGIGCRLGSNALDTAGIDRVTQLLRRFEEGNALGGDVYALARLGIAANTGIALPRSEATEAANLNLVASLEGSDDRLKEGVYDDFAIASGEVSESGHSVDQVGLRHRGISSHRNDVTSLLLIVDGMQAFRRPKAKNFKTGREGGPRRPEKLEVAQIISKLPAQKKKAARTVYVRAGRPVTQLVSAGSY
jgi:hypothetical protein